MAQLATCVEPFGEVNVFRKQSGELEVKATILAVPDIEGARVGLALDASASMKKMYGFTGLSGPFAAAAAIPNIVEPVARTMANFLANFSSDGAVDLLYWACGPGGSQIEPLGRVTADNSLTLPIAGPKKLLWGTGTKLLPPLRHYVELFQTAPALGAKRPGALCVFVTDGILEDLPEVKDFCFNYAQQISRRERPFMKLFLLGVGEQVDEAQMEELDDMFEGSNVRDHNGVEIDLWDHQLASDMKRLEEVFKEFVTEDMVVIGSGRVTTQSGATCRDYTDGVPALLRFVLPPGSTAFRLEFPGGSVTQELSEVLGRL